MNTWKSGRGQKRTSGNGLRKNPLPTARIGLAALTLAITALGGGQALAAPQAGAAEASSLLALFEKATLSGAVSDPFVITNNSGKALEIENSSTKNGARAQQWEYTGQSGAVWRFKRADDHSVYIVNEKSKKCLEIENSSTKNGARAQQWTCNDQAGAKWRIYSATTGDGKTRLLFRNHSGKFLEIENSSTKNGVGAQQWENKGQSGAMWY
ncbi:RICIN domain-containing protein [Streptomyces sp. NPDC059851]|uniref:RICIN domain-containing protein n=1 Tax=Streptomyces sp. NPDC059851 TaxID=3346971 RepID=UPI0036544718